MIRGMTYESLLDDLRKGYDSAADEREGATLEDWKLVERRQFLEKLLEEGASSLLEIGAGAGANARFFADNGLAVTCTDLSPELVERCRRKGLEAHVMDFLHLDFPTESFDALFSMNCLLHVPQSELQTVLHSIRRPLNQGGLFYWGQYGGIAREGVREDDHYVPKRFFSSLADEVIQAEAQKVFELLEFHTVHHTDDAPIHYQALLLRKPG
jgi:cyclopropane fatty-acyl-phospholipid synthase-like methyltransferase